ncbi:MAG: response regulator [Planctomycetota bacterium]
MKYQEISPAIIRNAIQIYLLESYPLGVPERVKIPPAVWDGNTTEMVLSGFAKDNKMQHGHMSLARWVLRLGNDRYPFTKFVISEYLIEGEYVLEVDTHDDMDIRPHFPDYEKWQQLKNYNNSLRERIEAHWQREHLDTCSRLREKMLSLPVRQNGFGKGLRALVVDNEPHLREAFASILRSEGFEVAIAADGIEALERVRAEQPDLIVTDCQMPGIDGLQLIDQLHADPQTRSIPILLTSAKQLSLAELSRAPLFLSKPFSTESLLGFCESMVRKNGRARIGGNGKGDTRTQES